MSSLTAGYSDMNFTIKKKQENRPPASCIFRSDAETDARPRQAHLFCGIAADIDN